VATWGNDESHCEYFASIKHQVDELHCSHHSKNSCHVQNRDGEIVTQKLNNLIEKYEEMLLGRKKKGTCETTTCLLEYIESRMNIYVCVQVRKNVIVDGDMRPYRVMCGTFQSFQHFCGG
jgi:hypothetical protein